jgi:hypothetical protein
MNKKNRAAKRPLLNYIKLGLSIGDVLFYKNDPSITVSVYDGTHILYEGEITKLTPVTCKVKNRDYTLQPSPFWVVKKTGKLLSIMYEEKYPRR